MITTLSYEHLKKIVFHYFYCNSDSLFFRDYSKDNQRFK